MITHIAGQHVTINDRYRRQRCAWCGVVLLDYDLTRTAVPVGQEGPPATWPAGALVTVDGGASWIDETSDKLPDDACAKPAETDAWAALDETIAGLLGPIAPADCPEVFKCPRCRCILTAGHPGLCDVHCGRPPRQEADRG